MKLKLYQLEKDIKTFLAAFLLVLTIGVAVGLIYLQYTTKYTPEGTVTRFNGSELPADDEFAIPENYPKPVSEMLITTHNHIIAFSFIFILLGSVFYFNSIINGFWKKFLMIEPFFSTVISFGSIWGMRYLHQSFVYLTVISAVLIYTSFLIMVAVSLYDLTLKKEREAV